MVEPNITSQKYPELSYYFAVICHLHAEVRLSFSDGAITIEWFRILK